LPSLHPFVFVVSLRAFSSLTLEVSILGNSSSVWCVADFFLCFSTDVVEVDFVPTKLVPLQDFGRWPFSGGGPWFGFEKA
jgi:hypothetical protein